MINRPLILAVDDDDLVLESLQSELGRNFEVLTSDRAHKALGILEQHEIDCVISDVRMPGMDGVTFLREVGDRFPYVGRILITAFTDSQATEAARFERGIFKVSKPWRDELDIAVRRALELRSMRLDLDRNLQRFCRVMEFDRQVRQVEDPARLIKQAMLDLDHMKNTMKIELVHKASDTKKCIAVVRHGDVAFIERDAIPDHPQLREPESSFRRVGSRWCYQSDLWNYAGGVTSLSCILSSLSQEDLSWIDFVVERLVDSLERCALSQEVQEHRLRVDKSTGQLNNMEKMASLGLLAAGVAHEINNPAAYVHANLLLFTEYLGDLTDAYAKLEQLVEKAGCQDLLSEWKKIEESEQLSSIRDEFEVMQAETVNGVERIIDIAMNLKTFARRGINERTRVELAACLEKSLAMMMYRYKHGINVERDCDPTATALGTVAEFGQVFLNLLLNAAQAMDGKGTIWISVKKNETGVQVQIRDSGPGIGPEFAERIFEPLFTTKEYTEGTGLGLSISKEIIERYGGVIEVTSPPGEGACFSMRFPLPID